jgi:S1-C subfamily serine protease
VIVGIDEREIRSRADLMSTLNSYGEGDVVRVTVSRYVNGEDRLLELPVTLQVLSDPSR